MVEKKADKTSWIQFLKWALIHGSAFAAALLIWDLIAKEPIDPGRLAIKSIIFGLIMGAISTATQPRIFKNKK